MTTLEIGGRRVVATHAVQSSRTRTALLVCGILSSMLYVATDLVGGLRYDGYRFMSQAVSELGAIGAPSKPLVTPLFFLYDVLIAAFGVGVLKSAQEKRALRSAAAYGKRFRVYSIATIGALIVCGGLAAMDAPRLAARQPTPWLGLTERINIYGYLLWVAVLATVVLRRRALLAGERG